MKTVPTFIVEEHNEAFMVWNYAMRNHILKSSGNVLFHIDDHSDMTTGRTNIPLTDINKWSLPEIKAFTYSEITIASFIMAGCFMKIFDQVTWVKRGLYNQPAYPVFITSYNGDGKYLLSGKATTGSAPLLTGEHHVFQYQKGEVECFTNTAGAPVVLDIDLDYFSCIIRPEDENEIIVEITRDEYEEFKSTPYHPLRYALNRVETRVEGEKYFYIFNYYHDLVPANRKMGPAVIKKECVRIAGFLKEQNICPCLITICRSRHSGYTPNDQWEMIEKCLLSELKTVFNLDLINTSELC